MGKERPNAGQNPSKTWVGETVRTLLGEWTPVEKSNYWFSCTDISARWALVRHISRENEGAIDGASYPRLCRIPPEHGTTYTPIRH